MADGGVVSGPALYAMLGAGAGAMLDKKDPLRGAALGGMGGYFGGPLLAGGAGEAAGTGLTAGAGEGALLGAGGTSSGAGLGLKATTDAAMLGAGPGSGFTGGLSGMASAVPSSLPAAGNSWGLLGGASAAPGMGFKDAMQMGGMGVNFMKPKQGQPMMSPPPAMPVYPQQGQSQSFASLSPYGLGSGYIDPSTLRKMRGY